MIINKYRHPLFDPSSAWSFVIPWLCTCAIMLGVLGTNVVVGFFHDPDDTMRLLQVRDLLAGQSWFDVTQYRLNAPDGAPMHWSRLVDIPLAATILLLRPFLGQEVAELVTRNLVPLLTLGVAMALVSILSRKLLEPRSALLAVLATPFSVGVLAQLMPMRIDHHGWQIALALLMSLAVVADRGWRSGLVAGAAAAAWFNISVEALPLIVTAGAWFAWRWLTDPRDGQRLKMFAASFGATSLFLFFAMRAPSVWLDKSCDAVSAAHLMAFCAAAATCIVGVRADLSKTWMRLGVLLTSATAAGAMLYVGNSQCIADPFASLDPLVRQEWYDRVHEGLPMWRQRPWVGPALLAQPLVGLAGALLAFGLSTGELRQRWAAYLIILCGATAASLLVARTSHTASVLAMPATGYLAGIALKRARAVASTPLRIAASFFALLLVLPAYAVPLAFAAEDEASKVEKVEQRRIRRCVSAAELKGLRQLPTGDVASTLDLSPSILAYSDHRAIASGHHRNMAAMGDVIRFFKLPEDQARLIAQRRGIEYVIDCPEMLESKTYAQDNPTGLGASLASGRTPSWLEPVTIRGVRALRIWRVRQPG